MKLSVPGGPRRGARYTLAAMTFWQATEQILMKARRPITAAEILNRATRAGLITTAGKTPLRTLTATLYMRSKDDRRIERVFEPGPVRARRGTVRWQFREDARAGFQNESVKRVEPGRG